MGNVACGSGHELKAKNEDVSTAEVRKDLRTSDIVELPGLQIRDRTSPLIVKQYANQMRNGATFPPIKVARMNGAYAVVDGWHRLGAARLLGVADVDAVIVPCEGPSEARWMAAEANLTHGQPLKQKAKREVFRAYVKAGKHRKGRRGPKSSREMAADLHGLVSHQGLLNWMQKDFPAVYRQMRGSEESPSGAGGLRESDSDGAFSGHVADAMEQALAAFRGVRNPEVRGQIVGQFRAALRAMEEAGGWVDPGPQEEDF